MGSFLVIGPVIVSANFTYASNHNYFEYQIISINDVYLDYLEFDLYPFVKSGDIIIWKLKSQMKGDSSYFTGNFDITVNGAFIEEVFYELTELFGLAILMAANDDSGGNTFDFLVSKTDVWEVRGDTAIYNRTEEGERSIYRRYDKQTGILEEYQSKDLGGVYNQELSLKKIKTEFRPFQNPPAGIIVGLIVLVPILFRFKRIPVDITLLEKKTAKELLLTEWFSPLFLNREGLIQLRYQSNATIITLVLIFINSILDGFTNNNGFAIRFTFTSRGYQPIFLNTFILPFVTAILITVVFGLLQKIRDYHIPNEEIFRAYGLATYWSLFSWTTYALFPQYFDRIGWVVLTIYLILYSLTFCITVSKEQTLSEYFINFTILIFSFVISFLITIPLFLLLS